MNNVFVSTRWNGSTRRMAINSERILFVEPVEKDTVVIYIVRFDTGCELELDEGTGKAFERELGKVSRSQPAVQYVPASDSHLRPPRYPRRRMAEHIVSPAMTMGRSREESKGGV